jgi:hypothetical protein
MLNALFFPIILMPLAITACGLWIASSLQSSRWIVHLISIVSMWILVPLGYGYWAVLLRLAEGAFVGVFMLFVVLLVSSGIYIEGGVRIWNRRRLSEQLSAMQAC